MYNPHARTHWDAGEWPRAHALVLVVGPTRSFAGNNSLGRRIPICATRGPNAFHMQRYGQEEENFEAGQVVCLPVRPSAPGLVGLNGSGFPRAVKDHALLLTP